MDDEETIWRLGASCLSGFAIPHSPNGTPQCEIPIHIPIERIDLQVSQTLETHSFPYYLQLILSPRARTDAGLVLLVPLNQIVSVLVLDHGSRGQSLRFKLLGTRNRGIMRQAFLEGAPGKVYGVNEDDAWHLLGMLKFGEFVIRNAGSSEQQVEAMFAWTECLKRNAWSEYGHVIQLLREGLDGVWTIIEEYDGAIEEVEDVDEKMDEELEEADMEGSLGISSMVIPEDNVDYEPSEEAKGQSEGMEIVGAGGDPAKYIRSDETPDLSDITIHLAEATSHHQTQSPYITPRESPEKVESEPHHSSDDTFPDIEPLSPSMSPVHQSPRRPQSSSQRAYSFPQQNYHNKYPNHHFNPRGYPLTGTNTIACRSRPNSSSRSPQFRHTHPPHPLSLRSRISSGAGFMPYRRVQRRPNSGEPFRPFAPRYKPNFSPRFQIRHFSGFNSKPYDSYRPASREGEERVEFPHFRNTNIVKRRRKAPQIERRE